LKSKLNPSKLTAMSLPHTCVDCGKASDAFLCLACLNLIKPSVGMLGTINVPSAEPDGPSFVAKLEGIPLKDLQPYQFEQLFESYTAFKTRIWRRNLRNGNAAG